MTPPNPSHLPLVSASKTGPKTSNFLRQIIEKDIAEGTYASRHWAGSPGDAAHHAQGEPDKATIRLRFPPEPNGYLHIGHAKSICLNFGLAREYGGVCHLRLDDTNPEKEDPEYVVAIKDAVQWLGFDWHHETAQGGVESNLYQASDYFGFMARAAEYLIDAGLAYVDEQTPEQIRNNRGDFGRPGIESPYRQQTPAENRLRFDAMRSGDLPDGAAVLRAKIDMASPNINLRDPALYRIRHAEHHHTGNAWCIYPLYTFAHPVEDALEQITHSICTLEFEDQRPFYDWLLDHLAEGGLIATPRPHQIEFARLNLTYVLTSKRKLAQLVLDKHVSGWDDPRLPTLAGLRRRGYTPEALRLFCERIGVAKTDSWIDYSTLEGALRDTLEPVVHRAMAVLEPLLLVIDNWAEVMGSDGFLDACQAPRHPHQPEAGQRQFLFGKTLWIEKSDYAQVPPKGFFRLYPGNKVRLKYGHVIECIGADTDAAGQITAVHARLLPDTKSGTPGSDSIKVKGVITWVNTSDALAAEVRVYDKLFTEPHPEADGKSYLEALNPQSLNIKAAFVEPSLSNAAKGEAFQFERHGYFSADCVDHEAAHPVFNQITGLKDSYSK